MRTSQKKKQVNQANRKRLEDGKDKSHLASGFLFFFLIYYDSGVSYQTFESVCTSINEVHTQCYCEVQ